MSDPKAKLDDLKKNGFYNEQKQVRPALFDDVARELGRAFAQRKGDYYVSSSQVRGFYGDVKALEIKLQEKRQEELALRRKYNQTPPVKQGQQPKLTTDETAVADHVFRENEYLVRMILPKVYYVHGKESSRGKVSDAFRDFIEAGLGKVQRAHDFTIFVRLFESVVGFYYGYGGGK